jgi:hypothetical protein
MAESPIATFFVPDVLFRSALSPVAVLVASVDVDNINSNKKQAFTLFPKNLKG